MVCKHGHKECWDISKELQVEETDFIWRIQGTINATSLLEKLSVFIRAWWTLGFFIHLFNIKCMWYQEAEDAAVEYVISGVHCLE